MELSTSFSISISSFGSLSTAFSWYSILDSILSIVRSCSVTNKSVNCSTVFLSSFVKIVPSSKSGAKDYNWIATAHGRQWWKWSLNRSQLSVEKINFSKGQKPSDFLVQFHCWLEPVNKWHSTSRFEGQTAEQLAPVLYVTSQRLRQVNRREVINIKFCTISEVKDWDWGRQKKPKSQSIDFVTSEIKTSGDSPDRRLFFVIHNPSRFADGRWQRLQYLLQLQWIKVER